MYMYHYVYTKFIFYICYSPSYFNVNEISTIHFFSLFTPSLYCNNLVKLDFLYSTQYMILYGIHLHGMHLSHMHNYPHD